MTGTAWHWKLALVAASGCLLAPSQGLFAQQAKLDRSIPWSPLRDEAVVVEQAEEQAAPRPIGTGVRKAAGYEPVPTMSAPPVGSPIAGGSIPGRRLSSPRPARLAPRASMGQMHTQYRNGATVIEQLPSPAGEIYHEPMIQHEYVEGSFPGAMGGDCQSCSGAGCGNCCGNWNSCGPVMPCCAMPCPQWDNLEVFAGAHGFTGPANRGGSGSFGFHEGFNYATPLCNGFLSAQIGAQWTQSNLDGSVFTPEERTQTFVTGGLFRRVDCGLQGGVVFDYLHDEWDYDLDLTQIRGEASWKFCGCHEIGFWFATGLEDRDITIANAVISDDGTQLTLRDGRVQWEVNDMYAFFYRRQFACGGEGRAFSGWSDDGQVLVGGDIRLPINACWTFQTDFLYIVPTDDNQTALPEFAEETWNLAFNLVWTPFKRSDCGANYGRPLLNVANNGSFVTRFE